MLGTDKLSAHTFMEAACSWHDYSSFSNRWYGLRGL